MRRFFNLPIDWFVLIIPIIVTVIGIVTIYTITFQQHDYRLAIDQAVFALLGLATMAFFMFTDYRLLQSYAFAIYGAGLLLLIPLLPPLAFSLPFVPHECGGHG